MGRPYQNEKLSLQKYNLFCKSHMRAYSVTLYNVRSLLLNMREGQQPK